ncbi:hypothetical protein [Neorhodopirellula lusitana]|uniref:hypothetical protein n=1 Tax=Neorhodopirellula lusitana TaxID=445327 RepID=UPI00384A7383
MMNFRAAIFVTFLAVVPIANGGDPSPVGMGAESREGILRYRGLFSGDFQGSELQFDLSFGHTEFSTRNVFFLGSSFERHPFWIDVDGLKKLAGLKEIEAVYIAKKRTVPPEVLKCHSDSFAVYTFRTTSGAVGKMLPGALWVLVVNLAESDAATVLLDRVDDDRPPEVRVFKSTVKLNSSIPPVGG